MRLLLPQTDQTSFGIKSTTMGKLYTRMLGIDPKSEEAEILSGVRSSSKSKKGDYADIVYAIIKNRFTTSNEISVFEVSRYLEEISFNFHNNNRKKMEDDLFKMISTMSADEQKWIVRVVLKSLHLGIGQKKILSIFNPKAVELFENYSDLQKVCELIDSGKTEIEGLSSITLFSHIRPMLCGRIDMKTIEEKCLKQDFYVETKMDGERFQLHKENDKYIYFSRNGIDYSQIYGVDILDGTLTPHIDTLLSKTIKSVIFDGEMMVWNKENLFYHSKGENFDVKTLQKSHPTLRPCFCIFDLLYYNGESLLNKPLAERITLLHTIVTEKTGILTICENKKLENGTDVIDCLNKAIDNKEEGIVVKEFNSVYKPNNRNGGWYKIKPDYIDGLVADFDLVIIGGYYNKKRTFIDSFLLGVQNNSKNKDDPIFYAVAKVSQGLSYDEWRKINSTLKPHWNNVIVEKIGRKNVIKNLELRNLELGNSFPDVYIDAKMSIVLEVKAAELVKTSTFRTNYTLRFPRITARRDDKNWDDCCTLDEFQSLCISKTSAGASTSSTVQKIAKRYIADEQNEKPKRQKTITRKPKVIPKSTIFDEKVEKIDDVCKGLEFCVLSTSKKNPKYTIEELEMMILRHGGKIVKNPGASTYAIIADDLTLRVKNLLSTKTYNIVKVSWLLKALGSTEPLSVLLEFHPNDMISTTDKLEAKFVLSYDEYGDSYTNISKEDDLLVLLNGISSKEVTMNLTKNELHEIELEMFNNKKDKIYNIFRLSHGIFYNLKNNFDIFKLSELIYKSRGGTTDSFDSLDEYANISPTHIFVDEALLNLNELMELIKKYKKIDINSVKLISYKWIIECDKDGKVVNEKKYLMNETNMQTI